MKHTAASYRGLFVITAVGLLCCVVQAEGARKIRLPPPGKSIQIEGKLHGMADHKEFVFQGTPGMKVKIELSGAGPLRGEVTFPSQGKHEGAPGGIVLDELLTESGRYRLKISESSMGESWDGRFKINISVAQ
jgi:hypothetical protein